VQSFQSKQAHAHTHDRRSGATDAAAHRRTDAELHAELASVLQKATATDFVPCWQRFLNLPAKTQLCSLSKAQQSRVGADRAWMCQDHWTSATLPTRKSLQPSDLQRVYQPALLTDSGVYWVKQQVRHQTSPGWPGELQFSLDLLAYLVEGRCTLDMSSAKQNA